MTTKKIRQPKVPLELTATLLRTYLHYDETTGELKWKVNRKRKAMANTTAGHYNAASGNTYISFLGKKYICSHIIFLYMENRLPSRIEYIDGNRQNLSWQNLKEHPRSLQVYTSGFKSMADLTQQRTKLKGKSVLETIKNGRTVSLQKIVVKLIENMETTG
jgi:hypothetical protein